MLRRFRQHESLKFFLRRKRGPEDFEMVPEGIRADQALGISWVTNLKTSKFSLSAFVLCYQFISSGCPVVVYRLLSKATANLGKLYLKLES